MHIPDPAAQLPSLDAYSDLPLFNTKAVVHQTGVPGPTLRAWERRYSILVPRRGDNDYRLYSERDIATVTWLRERAQSGMTISQAIALLKSRQPSRRRGRKGIRASHAAEARANESGSSARLNLVEMQRDLVRQFAQLDEAGACETMALALAAHAVEDVCLELLTPALHAIGEQWRDGSISSLIEHFAAAVIRAQLESLFRGTRAPTECSLILVGCAPGELHEMGALMLALFLRRAGMRVAYVGQSVEEASLIDAARRMRPSAIVLSSALPQHAAALQSLGERLATLPRPRPLLAFGGAAFAIEPALAVGLPGVLFDCDPRDLASTLKAHLSA